MLDQFDDDGVETLLLPVLKVAVNFVLGGLNDHIPSGVSDYQKGLSLLINQKPAILGHFQRQGPIGCLCAPDASAGRQNGDENCLRQ